LNVTNTASGAASNLLDLQVDTVSKFAITKGGQIIGSAGTALLPTYSFFDSNWGTGYVGWYKTADMIACSAAGGTATPFSISHIGLKIQNSIPIGWTSSTGVGTLDTILIRDGAANTLAMRNGVNAQTFRLYNTYTDATTFERLNIKWDTNVLKIGTEKGGSGGTARDLILETDATERLRISSAGNVGIGVSGASTGAEILYLSNVFSSTNVTYLRIDNTNNNGSIGLRLGSANAKADFYYDNVTTQSYLRGLGSALNIGTFSGNGNAYISFVSFQQERMRITGAGNVGIGTTTPTEKLDVIGNLKVSGHFSATTKSFLIPHPTKPDKKLQYACLEGPENGVYIRGKTNEPIILLPDYWSELVDADSITVTVTPIGKPQQLFVVSQNSTSVEIGNVDGLYNYLIFAERKDVNKLQTEI